MDHKIEIINISLNDIDVCSESFDMFLFSYNRDVTKIIDSIKDAGLINPVILRDRQNSSGLYTIVCGYQRIKAYSELRMAKIPARVICDASDDELTLLSLNDNLFSGIFNEIEKAIVIKKFQDIGYSEERLITEITSKLSIAPNKKIIAKHLSLLKLENEIKNSVASKEIEMEKALLLLDLNATERAFVYDLLFKEASVNFNEAKEVIRNLIDIAQMQQQEITEILTSSAVVSIYKDESLNKRKKGERITGLIKKLRYPRISRQEEHFNNICKELNLDSSVRVNHTKYFEQNGIQINIKSPNEEKLKSDVAKLVYNLENGKFKQIFVAAQGKIVAHLNHLAPKA
ncbi:MAG: ParB/RepB/Spo0J family partition protein [Candidatus Anammoxibacter sp.]